MDDTRPFDRVECDLSDVLGSPGVAGGPQLLETLHADLGGAWDAPGTDGVLVAGVPDPDTAGAFPPVRRRLALTEAVLAPDGQGGAAERVDGMVSALGRHEVWQQVVRGAHVVGATYRLHEGPGGRVALSGRPLGDLAARDPGPRPATPVDVVRRAARAAAGLPARTPLAVEPVVFPIEGRGVWAWKCEGVVARPPADVRVFLAADDLRLLVSYDVACRALFGEATVHTVSPARTPAPLGARLVGLAAPDRLAGPALVVRPARGEPVSSPAGDFRRPPGDVACHQVSAYHHVQTVLRWVSEVLGPEVLTRPPLCPLTVVTDDPAVGAQVAVFVPSQQAVRLHRGTVNAALSADVLAHEVAHAVADGVCRLTRSAGGQARALGEGLADYVACSLLGDPRFGDYVAPALVRDCSDPGLGLSEGPVPEDDPYGVGAVWAALLWDLRGAVGPGVADALALHALYYLGPGSTLPDGVAALLEADRVLFPDAPGPAGAGRHVGDVQRLARVRGL